MMDELQTKEVLKDLEMLFRRRARILALQVLFANEFLNEPVEKVIQQIGESLETDIPEFTRELVELTTRHNTSLNQLIKSHLRNWDFDRIPLLDRVIIKIALCEMLYIPDIPPQVSINEALEISKQFSSEKSKRFINGILDCIFKELKAKGQLRKTIPFTSKQVEGKPASKNALRE